MKRLTQRTFKAGSLVAASLVCLAMAGCGGGDGGDAGFDFEPVVITVGNMPDIAGAVIMTNSVGSSLVGGTDVLPGVEASSPPPSPAYLLAELAVKKLDSVKGKLAGADVVSGTQYTEPLDCEVAGTLTLTWDDRDNDLEPSPGDVISITANNCQEYDDTVLQTLTGTLRMTINSYNPLGLTDLTAQYIDLKFAQPDFTITSDGTMRILETYVDLTTTQISIQSNSLVYVVAITGGQTYETHALSLDFDGTEYLGTMDDRIEWTTTQTLGAIFPTFMGSFDVTTLETVVEYYKNINAGKLKVTGANNTVLYVTFQGNNAVLLELDSNNDGIIDVETPTTVQALNPIYDFD
jgi:hypothetical protein